MWTVHRAGIRVGKLAIRGLPTREVRDQVVERIRWELSAVSEATNSDGSWIFVRKVTVRTSARRVPAQVHHALEARLADDADVVRFSSFAEMVAVMIDDIAHGRLSSRWIWSRWRSEFAGEIPTALTRVLSQTGMDLPDVCAHLARRNVLGRAWATLDPAHVPQIAAVFAASRGFGNAWSAWRQLHAFKEAEHGTSEEYRLDVPQLPIGITSAWRPILEGLQVDDPRRTLALLIICAEVVPNALMQNSQATLRRFGMCFPGPTGPKPETAGHGAPPVRIGEFAESEGTELVPPPHQPQSTTGPTMPSTVGIEAPRPSRERDTSTLIRHETTKARDRGLGDSQVPYTENDCEPAPLVYQNVTPVRRVPTSVTGTRLVDVQPADVTAKQRFGYFHTDQGGLFYLCNLLDHPHARNIMARHYGSVAGGWVWLYRVGKLLDLDDSDPIVAFVASQVGDGDTRALWEVDPLPQIEDLLRLASGLYGRLNVWNSTLLTLSAQVRHSPSHIDVYAGLNAIRLDIRLAGLDKNPGWLPWLGRVVTFHYD